MPGMKQVVAVIGALFVATVFGQQSICFRPPETGNCRAFLPSFFYNPQIRQCDCFVFGGCNSGGNQFSSLDSCMQTCGVNPSSQTVTSECSRIFGGRNGRDSGIDQNTIQQQGPVRQGPPSRRRPEGCLVSPETGTCRAFIPSYYFNPQTGSCDCFAFGGCRPNPNNFASVSDCMETCLVDPSEQFLSSECIRLFGSQTGTQQPSTSGQQPGQGQTGSQIDPNFIRQNPDNQNSGNQNFGNQNLGPVVSVTQRPFIAPTSPTFAPIQRPEVRDPPQSSITRLTPVSATIISPSGSRTGQLTIGQPVRITG